MGAISAKFDFTGAEKIMTARRRRIRFASVASIIGHPNAWSESWRGEISVKIPSTRTTVNTNTNIVMSITTRTPMNKSFTKRFKFHLFASSVAAPTRPCRVRRQLLALVIVALVPTRAFPVRGAVGRLRCHAARILTLGVQALEIELHLRNVVSRRARKLFQLRNVAAHGMRSY